MSSNNLSLEDFGSIDISSDALSNKETQTSSAYITDSFDLIKGPSRPLPKGIDISDVEPTVNNILDCRVLKVPSESKSKELEAESFFKSIIKSNQSVSTDDFNDFATSLNYCKEVAEPYLKSHLNDCEDNVESIEKLIQDALEDLPDYQPCFEVYEGQNDILEKVNVTSSSKMDNIPDEINNQKQTTTEHDPTTQTVPEKTDEQPIPKSSLPNINILKPEPHSNEVHLAEEETIDPNQNTQLNRSVSMESITKCVQDSLIAMKRCASSCLDKIEFIIGIKKPLNSDEKPTHAIEKSEEDINSSHNAQTEIGNSLNSLKNMLNNPTEQIAKFTEACKDFAENLVDNSNETICALKGTCKNFAENLVENSNEKICAIKVTCKDFAENLMNNSNEKICTIKETCKNFAEELLNKPDEKIHTMKKTCQEYADKLYTNSKDAITLLTSESAKFLPKPDTGLKSDENLKDNQTKQKIRNISAESITTFLFKKAENKPAGNEPPKDQAITGPSRITDAIPLIPPSVKLNVTKIKDDIVSAKVDKSSPYDKVLPRKAGTKPPDPPEVKIPTVSAIDHNPDPPASSNVFEIIRSKIFSIFRDEGEKSSEPVIQENQDDDEEEDPFERFMEQ